MGKQVQDLSDAHPQEVTALNAYANAAAAIDTMGIQVVAKGLGRDLNKMDETSGKLRLALGEVRREFGGFLVRKSTEYGLTREDQAGIATLFAFGAAIKGTGGKFSKVVKTFGSGDNASSVNAQVALYKKMSALEGAQKEAVKIEHLSDGRIRYYDVERPARNLGPTRGSSFVTEYNPKTGQVRQWNESYDQFGDVNRIHPKTLDGQDVRAQHYPSTKSELEKFLKKPGDK